MEILSDSSSFLSPLFDSIPYPLSSLFSSLLSLLPTPSHLAQFARARRDDGRVEVLRGFVDLFVVLAHHRVLEDEAGVTVGAEGLLEILHKFPPEEVEEVAVSKSGNLRPNRRHGAGKIE